MKPFLTTVILFTALVFGSFTSNAQEVDFEQVYNNSKKTALVISEKLDLNVEETQYLTRFITSREQNLAKVKAAGNELTEKEDAYLEKINEKFKKNAITIFGEEKAKMVFKLYEI